VHIIIPVLNVLGENNMKHTLYWIAIILLFPVMASAQLKENTTGEFDKAILVGLGYFAPAKGTGGVTLHGGFYIDLATNISLGGEMMYSGFKSEIFGYPNVGFTAITLFGSLKYLLSNEKVQPYIGGSMGVSYNVINKDDLPSRISLQTEVASSLGLGALVGIRSKMTETVSLFAEARYGVNLMQTELVGYDKKMENYGGFTIMGGLLVSF
jgi:hypothetical protein